MKTLSKSQKIAIAVIVSFLFLIGIALFATNRAGQNNKTGEYLDPYSHQTVSNPPGKGPDTYGTQSDTPVYLGIEKLLDHGLSFDQLDNLKYAFYRYSLSRPNHIHEVSLDVDHITTKYNSSDPNAHYFIFFNVRFDRKNTYKAQVEYTGLNDVRLYLIDVRTNKVLYDSLVIGAEAN
jgi:hypothetical protein